ncbi:MAG: hypothetical protein NZ930_02295 [Candidatus Bipolaricaulota bacterium]|nr:hypothetical protein [Candidatus Bipolaricaulota bacterium]MDW8030882.1 hypothetical protein [Candidatus Bipolaricaulota bacterium]
MRYAIIVLSLLFSVGFVGSQLGYAQTISIESDQLSLGAAVWLPIAINAAPDGIHRYVLSVVVDVPEIAHIEDVRFPEPVRDFASFQIAPDGNSVQIAVRDENDVITSGAQQTLLAEVKLRGTFGGRTGVTLAVREIVNDRLNAFNVAVANGQLTVAAAPSAPTLVVGFDGVLVGDTVRVPIILTSTVGGVQSYRARVRLERRDVATFIGAEFPFFADQQDVSITPDGNEITVGARDGVNAVQAGAKGILLAWLVLRGDLPDGSPLRLLSNNITEDNNNSGPLPSKDGLLTVIRLENLPPEFFGPQPRPQEILGDRSPSIQITISDDKNAVLSETIQLTLQDEVQTLQFGWRSPGASWDPTARLFTVNLKAIGVQLSGDVRARIRARDRQGAEGRFEWRFTVPRGEMPPPPPGKTLEDLLDADRDNRLNDLEILRALDAWIKGAELAPGLKIDDLKMLALIDAWIKGTPLRPTAPLIVQETLPVPF